MKHLVSTTAIKTAMAVILAFLIGFGIFAIGFPQHMATMFENIGAYSVATGFSSLRYSYTKNIDDLARCIEDSILAEDEKDIVSFCDKMFSNGTSEFEEYAATRPDRVLVNGVWVEVNYRQYILGALASARYITEDKDGAIAAVEYALSTETGFPVPNAAGDLAETLHGTLDYTTKAKLYTIVNSITPEEGQETYYTSVLLALSN